MLYEVFRGVIQGVAEHHKQKHRPYEYENLTTTPYLHSSQYLNELYTDSRSKHEKECILDHLYRHHANGRDILEIESYAKLEKKIMEGLR
jgi:hypothetical protein